MQVPATHFLADAAAYDEAVQFWRELVAHLLDRHHQRGAWEPWLTTTYADGTPFRDGNPIYNLVNRERRRALRIIQQDPGEGHAGIGAWLDQTGEEDEIDELVIACVLTPEAAQTAEKILDHWIARDSTRASTEHLLSELLRDSAP